MLIQTPLSDGHLQRMNTGHFGTLVRGGIGLIIGAVFLWLALRQTSLEQIRTIIAQSHLGWILFALTIYMAALLVRALRWRILLLDVKKLPLQSVGLALLIGYAANNLLPARLGEFFRADFAGQRYHLSRSTILGSIFVERVLDGLVLVLCLLAGRPFIQEQAVLSNLTTISALFFISIFLILCFFARASQLNWLKRWPPVITTRVLNFRKGLLGIRGNSFQSAVYLSCVIWALEGTMLWSMLKGVDIAVGWGEMLSVIGIASLSTLIPSAPGFVGTYQYAYAYIVSLFGYEPERGIAAATAVQIFLLGSVTLLGIGLYLYCYLMDSRKAIKKN